MKDEEVAYEMAQFVRDLVSDGATRRQIYDAMTRATNDVFGLGAKLPDGHIHNEG